MIRLLAILLACLHLHVHAAPDADPLPADPAYHLTYPPDLGGPFPQITWQAHVGLSYDGRHLKPDVHIVAGN